MSGVTSTRNYNTSLASLFNNDLHRCLLITITMAMTRWGISDTVRRKLVRIISPTLTKVTEMSRQTADWSPIHCCFCFESQQTSLKWMSGPAEIPHTLNAVKKRNLQRRDCVHNYRRTGKQLLIRFQSRHGNKINVYKFCLAKIGSFYFIQGYSSESNISRTWRFQNNTFEIKWLHRQLVSISGDKRLVKHLVSMFFFF